MTNRIRIFLTGVALLSCSLLSNAQSQNFRLGKWTEIQTAILKELSRSYVDTLDVDKIERAGIDAMLSQLDPYTVFVPEEENEDLQMMVHKSYGGIGAVIYKPDIQGNVIINEPYEGSAAAKYGLRCGDEILSIDGVSTHGLTSTESSERMRGDPNTEVVFEVKKVHTGDTVSVTVTRQRIHIPDVEYYGMLDSKTGYVSQVGFSDGVSDDVAKAFLDLKSQGMETFVLDLRGNGGGLLSEAINIVSLFVDGGETIVSSKGKNGNNQVYKTTKKAIDTEIPIIVLVDSGSASASEIVSGALQDLDRATIMGERTFGKGLVQSIRPLPYGGEIKLTTAKYYTPSGRCVQAIDYSRRNEDGSVGHIPDSLTREFKTAHGRIVRDGGGITPDVKLDQKEYSRITYSLVAYGIIDHYALDYATRHESCPKAEDFHFSDEDFEDFVNFAKTQEFDFRSSAKTYYDLMKAELEEDGLASSMSETLTALGEAVNMEKEEIIRLKKDEIVPFIEQEIITRYHFAPEGVKIRIRYDDVLKAALEAERIPQY